MADFQSLPDDLIVDSILSKIRDAKALLRCSAVARDWRRWTARVPALHFDFPKSWKQDCVVRSLDAEKIVWAAISRVQGGGIGELSLRFSPTEPSLVCLCENAVQLWIQHVSASVRELKLSNKGCAFSELLPSLSRCARLSSLSLEFGYFDGIPQGCRFPELKKCRFANVIFHGDDLERFVACCPALEELTIDECFSTQIPVVTLRSGSIRALVIAETRFNRLAVEAEKLGELTIAPKSFPVVHPMKAQKVIERSVKEETLRENRHYVQTKFTAGKLHNTGSAVAMKHLPGVLMSVAKRIDGSGVFMIRHTASVMAFKFHVNFGWIICSLSLSGAEYALSTPVSPWTCSLLPRANARASRHRHPSVLCFREDDTSPEFFPAVIRELPSAVLEFTPGGRFRRFQQPGEICSTSSNDWGSGNNNNDDGSNRRGWRGHGDNNNSGEKHSSLVAARVLLAFSAFHLGYCIAAWMRKDGDKLGIEFYGVGLGLVCFLATAAVFVSFFVSFGFQRSCEQ
ncbi:hypothetical protein SELMODRAFT_403359 [Selaginella moellendorffii]|uniref:F-box/LRR-repeat protein 15/At3g58940/PEG3-like LRR domain-containing protein n=1 Tax=Selaginella moellendorffii TaxID=88036 RepID=D8QTX4_SELML|nr:hypothetical protein SELMODRAFT_403359 [Selaginella moellendorffii]